MVVFVFALRKNGSVVAVLDAEPTEEQKWPSH